MTAAEKKEIMTKVNAAIETIRPYLIADGGDVTLVEITDDLIVKVRLIGACDGCPFSLMTLKAGIEQAIRKKLPELKELIAVS
ncbi:MAG TPA: NifU family protein [Bacteroidales bacterium]|nr:NifU family protein [Bacteroidales bacterium]